MVNEKKEIEESKNKSQGQGSMYTKLINLYNSSDQAKSLSFSLHIINETGGVIKNKGG